MLIALLGLVNKDDQVKLCRKIVRQGLSVRETEVLVKQILRVHPERRRAVRKSPELLAIQEKLQHFFGTTVKLIKRGEGGRIEIEYYSEQDLERFLDLLAIESD